MLDFMTTFTSENKIVSHLTNLETILRWEGSIDNERIRQLLDVKTVWASRLMGELTARMGGLARRASAHAPLEFVGQSNDRHSADEYLHVIAHHDDITLNTLIEDARIDLSPIHTHIFSATFSAARNGKGIKILYRSMSSPSGRESVVFPHSIIRAPRRWHMRAWCDERKSFRDFTLGRIASAQPIDISAPYTKIDDVEWNQTVELIIAAHPTLSIEQQDMIAAEYFPGTNAKRLRVRQCLASYVIQDLRLALDPITQLPPEYQLVVCNATKLPKLFVSN